MSEDDVRFMVFEKCTFSEDLTRIHVEDACEVANAGEPIDMGEVDENENINWHGPFRSYVGARVAASERGRRDGPYDCPVCKPQDQ